MGNHFNYNQENHHLILAGITLKDYGKDSKFKIVYDNDFRTLQTGVDGVTTTSERAERSATITIKIQQASPLNLLLQELTEQSGFPMLYVNNDYVGDVGYKGENAFFTKIPDLEIGGDAGEREWTMKVPNLLSARKVAEDILTGYGG